MDMEMFPTKDLQKKGTRNKTLLGRVARRQVIDTNVRAIYRLKLDAKPGSVFGIQTAFHGVDDLGEKK